MKRLFFLFFLPVLTLQAAPDQDDAAVLGELIAVTKKTLEEQENLQKLLLDYQKKREKYIADPDSAKLATLLVKSAAQLQTEIEKDHLIHLFSEDLLVEVRFFAKVAKEKGGA